MMAQSPFYHQDVPNKARKVKDATKKTNENDKSKGSQKQSHANVSPHSWHQRQRLLQGEALQQLCGLRVMHT